MEVAEEIGISQAQVSRLEKSAIMNMKKNLLLLFLFVGLAFHVNAQNVTLVVTNTNGIEQTYQLTEESQLHFENGERLVIEDGSGTTATFQLASIQKLVCTEVTSVDENESITLQILPNPAHDCFFIKNIQNNTLGHVYALDGRLVKTFEASDGMSIDISDMAPGMYLLHIDGQTLKMIKQ